VIDNF